MERQWVVLPKSELTAAEDPKGAHGGCLLCLLSAVAMICFLASLAMMAAHG